MRGTILIVFAAIALMAVNAPATVITWGTTGGTANGDGTSYFDIYAQTDNMAIIGFEGTFYSSGPITQNVGDLGSGMGDPDPPYEWVQIDANAHALLAHANAGCGYSMLKDTWVGPDFSVIPAAFVETTNTYSGFAGSMAPLDSNQGKDPDWVMVVRLVVPTGSNFETSIGMGDLGYRGWLGLWDGTGDAVPTDAPFGIPEPATLVLLSLGGIGVLIRRRRA